MAKVVDLDDAKLERAERRRKQTREAVARHRAKNHVGVARQDGSFNATCVVCGDRFAAPRRGVRVCGEGGCAKDLAKKKLKPFTMRHFKQWAGNVVLDTEEYWKLEWFQEMFFEEVFAGTTEIWLLIGEGNTKTTMLAGLALYECQFKRGGRVPIAASSRDQAFEMYLQAQGIVERSEKLQPLFTCHEGLRQIKCESQGSRLQVYSADDRTGDGVIFTKALLDELHRQRDLRLYRTWSGKTRKRKNAQAIAISTAGEPGSEFEITRDKIRQSGAREVVKPGCTVYRSGRVTLIEHAVPEQADTNDMKVVKLANPFSGITHESLQEKKDSPTMTLEHWLRMTCNIATRSANAAIAEIEWFRQVTEIRIPAGFHCWAGLDVAWRQDTTALVPFWMPDPSLFYTAEELAKASVQSDYKPTPRPDLEFDARLVLRQLTDLLGQVPQFGDFRWLGPAAILEPPRDGTSLDPDLVEQALQTLHDRNPIDVLVMDTTKAEQLAVWAERTLGCQVVDRGQSNQMQALDYERWMEALRHCQLWHCNDPGMNAHVFNAVAKVTAEEKTKFARPVESRGNAKEQIRRVIDALVAAAMVHTTAAADIYESTGVVYG